MVDEWRLAACGLDLGVERNQAFGNNSDVIPQALGDDVEMAAGGSAFLAHFTAQAFFDVPDPVDEAFFDLTNLGAKFSTGFNELVPRFSIHESATTILPLDGFLQGQ